MAAPYDQLEAESAQAFEAFARYRDLGVDRTIKQVAQGLGKSEALCERWSQRYLWRRRARAWDNAKDAAKRKGELRGIEQMRERQIKLATAGQGLIARELKKLVDKSAASGKGVVNPDQLAKLLDVTTKLERVNRGEPGEIVGTAGRVDLSGLSTDELRDLKRMRAKVSKANEAAD